MQQKTRPCMQAGTDEMRAKLVRADETRKSNRREKRKSLQLKKEGAKAGKNRIQTPGDHGSGLIRGSPTMPGGQRLAGLSLEPMSRDREPN